MVEKSGAAAPGRETPAPRRWEDWILALEAALGEARVSLAGGDVQEAERCAKAVSALAKAVRDAAELEAFTRTLAPEEDDEEIRAELRGRIARFVEADLAGAAPAVLERIAMAIVS